MNNVKGIGTDIIEIKRIQKAILRYQERFLERVFTENERAYCSRYAQPEPHFAGRFAAKEASFKAIGTGVGAHIGWHDAEILSDDLGKPIVILSQNLLSHFPDTTILLSISHSGEYAMATAIYLKYGT